MASARYTGIVARQGMDGRIDARTVKEYPLSGGKCSRRDIFKFPLENCFEDSFQSAITPRSRTLLEKGKIVLPKCSFRYL